MTLEQLEVIIAIADSGSFRSAANKLNRSQPALSMAVKNLEDEFDLRIFDRSSYRPTLTDSGAAFLQVARKAYEAAQYTARVGHELGTKQAETRLHVSIDALASPEFIEMLALECSRPIYPVTLILEKSILDSSLERLLNGQIDLAIAPRTQASREIETLFLEQVRLKGAISRRLLQEKRKATQELLMTTPQIFAYDLNVNREPQSLPKFSKSETSQTIFVPDHATKFKLIAAGIGWGRICEKEFDQADDLIPIDEKIMSHIDLEISLVRSKKRALGPVARAIWAAFEKRQKQS